MPETRFVVTGSIATDHLMTFPGRIREQLIADKLDHISLSLLVDALDVRDGGAAADIAYGLALLGHRPLLVGAVGADFHDHGARLAALGVDTSAVHVSTTRHTARRLCTTDTDGGRLATFYPGATAEAAAIDLGEVLRRRGGADLVLIGADDPTAMARHTRACRALGVPFAADPGGQLARLTGPAIRELVEGADHLFTNEDAHELLLTRTGWTRDDVLRRTGVWITTLGDRGSRVERAGEPPVEVPAVPAGTVTDPAGAGGAFRAGYLASLAAGAGAERCARAGSALAARALSAVGSRTYTPDPGRPRAPRQPSPS
ncbi:PfkB family carbohydrate kinase [Streptomyces sp. NPDC008313]|uniref:PfkB family carbohydrate kinase n=1 Tax=Streptomyces sp. NPDC008313 TaxID=3364826 RepID=UPI0036EFB862